MGKRNKERGVPSQEQHLDLYKKAKQQSHTATCATHKQSKCDGHAKGKKSSRSKKRLDILTHI